MAWGHAREEHFAEVRVVFKLRTDFVRVQDPLERVKGFNVVGVHDRGEKPAKVGSCFQMDVIGLL